MKYITYAASISALQAELAHIYENAEHALNQHVICDDSGDHKFAQGNRLPVFYTVSGGSLCATTGIDRTSLESCESLQVLGEIVDKEYVFDSDESESLYDEQRGDLTATYTDDDGVEKTYSLPRKIGVFA